MSIGTAIRVIVCRMMRTKGQGSLENNKTCPEETLLQLGNINGTVSAHVLAQISAEYFEEFNKRYGSHVHILDWA